MHAQFEEIIGKHKEGLTTLLLTQQNKANSEPEQLAVLADFSELPESSRYLGALIASTLQRAWADKKGNDDAQRRLVASLRAVNDALALESRSGSAQWVGSLRAVVIAFIENQICFSSSGGFTAFLSRKGNATEIPLEPGEGARPFGSLTSGPLQINDELAIGPHELFAAPGATESLGIEPIHFFAGIKKSDQKGCVRLSLSANAQTKLQNTRTPIIENMTSSLKRLARFTRPNISIPAPNLSFPHLSVSFLSLDAFKKIPKLKFGRPKQQWSLSIVAITLFALGGTLLANTYIFKDRSVSPERAAALTEARRSLDAGETELILGNTPGALSAWEEGLALLVSLSEEDAEILRAELLSRRNTVSGIQTEQAEELASFTGFPLTLKPERFAISSTKTDALSVSNTERLATTNTNNKTPLALLDSHATALWVNQTLSGSGGTFIFLPEPLQEPLADVVSLADQEHFLVATQDGYASISHKDRLAQQSSKDDGSPQKRFLTADSKQAFAVLTESGLIQLIELKENEITVRVWGRNTVGEFAEAQDTTMAGDAIAILMPDNTFVKYRNGKRIGRYRIEGYGWQGSIHAFTSLSPDRLAALDTKNGRILITNNDGDIQRQIESPVLKNALDITPSPDGTILYILTSSSLLKLNTTE